MVVAVAVVLVLAIWLAWTAGGALVIAGRVRAWRGPSELHARRAGGRGP